MRLICDERAINGLGEEFKKDYAFVLISMKKQRSKMASVLAILQATPPKKG